MKNNQSPIVRGILVTMMLLSVVVMFYMFSGNAARATASVSSSVFQTELANKNIKTIKVHPDGGVYVVNGDFVNPYGDEKAEHYTTQILQEEVSNITPVAKEQGIDITVRQEPKDSNFIPTLVMMLVFGFFIFFLMKSLMNGKNSPMSVGENKASLATNPDKKFSDVIGYEEEKKEFVEIVDFLKNPQRYRDIGAKIPNGVLLEGPPGTGKTLMAKAVAGEAGVPFFFISGSNFVEMFVGVGASRVRNLFKEARKAGECIVFIDEIDAIGSREQSSMGGRNTEQEQTINALLVELDGFATDHGKGHIIIIGATNRADKLDPALLRPGRFDRRITMGLPELKAREEILRYHASKCKVSSDVDFKELSKQTTGMAGADLEAIINEAGILAVRNDKTEINYEMLDEAIDRVAMGPAKISNSYTDIDKQIVSYHETGHAIIGLELEGALKVQKITIIPRGNAGGYVMFQPDEEIQKMTTQKQLFERVISLLGGRASEEIYIGDVTIGAVSDLDQATRICRAMVTEYGMSSLGKYQYEHREHKQVFATPQYSDKTAEAIDAEINKMLDEAYEIAKEILTRRSEDVHLLAKAIREKETMSKVEIDYLMEHRELPVEKNSSEVDAKKEDVEKVVSDDVKNVVEEK